MMEPDCSVLPGGDTTAPASPEDRTRERVFEGPVESSVTSQNRVEMFKIIDQIEAKVSTFVELPLHMRGLLKKKEERLRVSEKEIGLLQDSIMEKGIESDLTLQTQASLLSLVLEKQTEEVMTQLKNALRLLYESGTKTFDGLMSEFEGKKEEARLLFESINDKLCLLERAEKEFDDRRDEESWQLEAKKNELSLLEVAIMQKSEELMRKEETFELKQKEEAQKQRDENKALEIKEKTLEEFALKQRVETERLDVESMQLEAKKNELNLLEEAIREKSAELKRKEEMFELKQKQETEKWREETELKRKGLENNEEKMKELELKQMEERLQQQLISAETLKRSSLEIEPILLFGNDSDGSDSLTRLAKRHKSQEEDSACALSGNTDPAAKQNSDVNDGAMVCTDKSVEDHKPFICPDTMFNDFSKSMNSFAVDQVWALHDPRDDMPRIYAQIKNIFDSQLSLQVTLLEHVKTTKDEKSVLRSCGRFKYGDTEIKSHLMFVHEMYHIKCGNHVIVNPRKGETWALFRDWNTSWNGDPDTHEPPYRYDFVEVISEFDDKKGVGVAFMGKVKGFVSVFEHAAEQHGFVMIVISPEEMWRFSHKVESIEMSGEEKKGVPAGCFELNPAATPSYDLVLKDGGNASTAQEQDGSTKDMTIIIN